MKKKATEWLYRWWFSVMIIIVLLSVAAFATPARTVLGRYYSYLPLSIKR